MEAFYTLQGEGFHQGKAAYFIRLAGCDVGCFWCDVKERWDAEKHPSKTIEEIINEAKQFPARLAVITGGEPLMHDLAALTFALKKEGFKNYRIWLERSLRRLGQIVQAPHVKDAPSILKQWPIEKDDEIAEQVKANRERNAVNTLAQFIRNAQGEKPINEN